jgi:DEAD/DEAH box helicase domain-containing protein
LGCAAHELPLAEAELPLFGGLGRSVAEVLAEEGRLAVIEGRHFWSAPEFPARKVNLRTISDDTYTIVEVAEDQQLPSNHSDRRVVGTVDAVSGLELVYPAAIYLHDGESYVVRKLDLEARVAEVERMEVDYYTQPVLDTAIRVRGEEARRALGGGEKPGGETSDARDGEMGLDDAAGGIAGTPSALVGFGTIEVTWQTVAMKKIRFRTRETIGYHRLDLPRLTLDTRSLWLWVGEEALADLSRGPSGSPYAALGGLRNLLVTLIPVHAMCDPADLGGVIDTRNLGRPCIFIFDRYPGGLGFAEQAYAHLEELIGAAADLACDCPCRDGCPSCVGLPLLRPAQQQDLDLHHGHPIPSKGETLALLARLRVTRLRAARAQEAEGSRLR